VRAKKTRKKQARKLFRGLQAALAEALICSLAFPPVGVIRAQESTSPSTAGLPSALPNGRSCSVSLWQAPGGGNPATTWNNDTAYIKGGSEEKESEYLTGDLLVISPESMPSLFKDRRPDLPNSYLQILTLDAREVVIDGALYFDSARVRIYADTVTFTSRGYLSFAVAPAPEQIEIITRQLRVAADNPHPLRLLTADATWTTIAKPTVTIVAASITGRPARKPVDQARSLTLDDEFRQFLPKINLDAAYSVTLGTPAGPMFEKYLTTTMLWPEQFADKVAREFARGPFDAARITSLRQRSGSFKQMFSRTNHILAAATLDNVLSAMSRGVDELGFHQYYIPRTSFEYERDTFSAQKEVW